MPAQPTDRPHSLLTAWAIADADRTVVGTRDDPAAIILENHNKPRVLAIGRLSEVAAHPAANPEASSETSESARIDSGNAVILPALANAHTHLDLSAIGPRPHDPEGSFVPWVNMIRAERPTDPHAIAEAVARGVAMSELGGVAAVGDIAGAPMGVPSLAAAEALARGSLHGVSFVEFFAIGTTEHERFEAFRGLMEEAAARRAPGRVRLGIQPHAPNTVSLWAYRRACELAAAADLPLMTHLAESADEQRFVADAEGPQRELLESLGLWTEELAGTLGRGLSPVEHLGPVLSEASVAAVHVNQCSDADLQQLARTRTPVVYCPRASDYFGAARRFGPHRYRDMLAAGLPVAIGTDSIVNLPPGTDRLSTLDEMRYLFKRDATDPSALLGMATVHAAGVLGMPRSGFELAEGSEPLGLIAVEIEPWSDEPLAAVLRSGSPPRWLWRSSQRRNSAVRGRADR
ncbi:MAG: amidohydrolase family protein [Planctomycetota bacterium]